MDNETLRRAQFVFLEIAKEIKRVCDENGIRYFLDSGTLLGAVRHKGFIPWDDDFDIGMMREEYDRFCQIAPLKLDSKYYLQTWENDANYAIPFAKVRKKNTIYLENKASATLQNGFYVDVFPYDNAPDSPGEKKQLMKKLANIERIILMKCHYQPWNEGMTFNVKKRLGYIPYQLMGYAFTKKKLIDKYMGLVKSVKSNGDEVYLQYGGTKGFYQKKCFFGDGVNMPFEDTVFRCPDDSDGYLKMQYGDYMKLPPVNQRENRHQIIQIKF